jgi:DNA-binding CsgD family transcriptional regulator/uncharacterized protein YecA (UPF0149 family)
LVPKKEKVSPNPFQKKEIFIKPPRPTMSMSLFTLLFGRKRPRKSEKAEVTEKAEHAEQYSAQPSIQKSLTEETENVRVIRESRGDDKSTSEYSEGSIQTPKEKSNQPAIPNPRIENYPQPTYSQSTLQQTQQQNRDFIYGVGYGYFKSDFEEIKEKLRKIQEDLANGQSLILGKTEEQSEEHRAILDQLGDNRKKLGILVEKAEQYSVQPSIPTELSEDLNRKVEAASLSLRQAEIYKIIKKSGQATAGEIAKQLSIAENTSTEHLRNLEKLGFLVRVNRGVYRINHTPSEPSIAPFLGESMRPASA